MIVAMWNGPIASTPPNQQRLQFVVGVPAVTRWGGHVAEHELECTGAQGELAVVIGVAVVSGGVVDRGDVLGGDVELGLLGRCVQADEAEVERRHVRRR